MSNDELQPESPKRVWWVSPHVRRRADGTEYHVKGYFVGSLPPLEPPAEGDAEESQ